MYDFLTLFYPVVNAFTLGDTDEIARLEQLKPCDPFYVVPAWNEETTKSSMAQVAHVQRNRMERDCVERILAKAKFLKEFPYVYAPPVNEGEVAPAYYEEKFDASRLVDQPNYIWADALAKQLWHKVLEIGTELIEKSKLEEAIYKKKPTTPLRIMVMASPQLVRYLDLYRSSNAPGGKMMLSQCLDNRIGDRIFIAVGRMQEDTKVRELHTFGTLKYTNPTQLVGTDRLKGYVGYQMHYEFIDNIPVLGMLEVENLVDQSNQNFEQTTNAFIK